MPLRFPLDKQLHDKWCWAAVTASVDRYLNPNSTLDQCKIAEQVLGRSCCPDGEACNQVESLDNALSKFNRLEGTASNFALSFTEIRQIIDARMPVCVRIGWQGGGGHFVVISGYRVTKSGRELLEIADPLFPSSILSYHDFVTSYQNVEQSDGGGQWTHTFLVKR
jgi:hypothetical protein